LGTLGGKVQCPFQEQRERERERERKRGKRLRKAVFLVQQGNPSTATHWSQTPGRVSAEGFVAHMSIPKGFPEAFREGRLVKDLASCGQVNQRDKILAISELKLECTRSQDKNHN
jgi:hypothetical protein